LFSLGKNIRFGIDAEIDKALSLFGRDEFCLSKLYWPKAFRELVITILEHVLKKTDLWEDFSTMNFIVDEAQLEKLIVELKTPSSHYIKVRHRQWIVHLLRKVSINRKKVGLSASLPKICSGSNDWPVDLEDIDDLSSAMADMSLRDDIREYFWKILDEVVLLRSTAICITMEAFKCKGITALF